MARGRKSKNGWSRNADFSGKDYMAEKYNQQYRKFILPRLRKQFPKVDFLTLEHYTYSEGWFEWCRLISQGIRSVSKLLTYVSWHCVSVAVDSTSQVRRFFGSETSKTRLIREALGLPDGRDPKYDRSDESFLKQYGNDSDVVDGADLFDYLAEKLKPVLLPLIRHKKDCWKTAAYLCFAAVSEENRRHKWGDLEQFGIKHSRKKATIKRAVTRIVKENYDIISD